MSGGRNLMRRKKQGPEYAGPCRADRKSLNVFEGLKKISAFINGGEIKFKKNRHTERGTYFLEKKEKKTKFSLPSG